MSPRRSGGAGRRAGLGAAGAALAAALLAGGPGQAPAGPPPELALERWDLEVGGRVTDVVPIDVAGNGRKDLLVVRGREALVFLQRDDGGFAAEPNQRFRFHPRSVLFDAGDLDGDGRDEVVLLLPDGLHAYRARPRPDGRALFGLRPERVAACPSFLTRPDPEEVRKKDLLRDLDGDGRLDAIVPRQDGFSLLQGDGKGGFAAPVVLPAPPSAALNVGQARLSSQLFASYWFPNPNALDWDADGRRELVLAREGVVEVYRGAAPGTLPTAPAGAHAIPDQRQLNLSVENPFELDFTTPLVLRDLDGDGRCDVASTHVGQGITRLFFNTEDPAAALATPRATIRAKGVTFLAFFVDLDGDGLDDLCLPRMDKIGVWSILKALVTRSVPVEMLVFYQRPGPQPFADEPDRVRALDIPLSIQSGGERGMRFGTTIIATLDGDLDGDRRRDLVLRTARDELGVWLGRPGRTMDDAPTARVAIPDVEPFRFVLTQTADLDGDGRDEVLLRYQSWDRDADRLSVVRARRGP